MYVCTMRNNIRQVDRLHLLQLIIFASCVQVNFFFFRDPFFPPEKCSRLTGCTEDKAKLCSVQLCGKGKDKLG